MEISPIDLREIDLKAENVYEGIIIATQRAKQINDENKIEFNALISTIPENTTEDDNEDIDNPAQLKIALELEKKPKPHVQALSELLGGDINFKYKEQQSLKYFFDKDPAECRIYFLRPNQTNFNCGIR